MSKSRSGALDAAPPPLAASTLRDMERDALRWRALLNSQRMHYMGSTGFKSESSEYADANPKAAREHMHFGMEFWNVYRLPKDYADNESGYCRRLLLAYVDEILRQDEMGAARSDATSTPPPHKTVHP